MIENKKVFVYLDWFEETVVFICFIYVDGTAV